MRKITNHKEHFLSKIFKDLKTGCWEWQKGKCKKGYGKYSILGKTLRAHRAALFLLTDVEESEIHEKVVCHKCDNPGCVNPEHLFIGTHQDNINDMVSKGRQNSPKGEECHNSKLTSTQVKSINSLLELGFKGVKIAKLHNTHKRQISKIKTGKAWLRLKEQA